MTMLATMNPRMFYLLVAGGVFLLIYMCRRFAPGLWDTVTLHRPKLQALPALLLSALFTAMPAFGKGMWDVITEVVIGVAVGGGTIAGHHILKAMPDKIVPYHGGKAHGDREPPDAPPGPPAPAV
jgi:hypothetical protein